MAIEDVKNNKMSKKKKILITILCVTLAVVVILSIPFEADATLIGDCAPSSCTGAWCTADCNGKVRMNIFEIIVHHIVELFR